MKTLSERQQAILKFLSRFAAEHNYPPTVRDIVAGCSVSSTSVVDYNLQILEREGYIRRRSGISRGIELVDGAAKGKMVPLVGVIAAGEPIPVPAPDVWDIAAGADMLEVTDDMVSGKQDVFALRVKGDSMIDSLINDGDIVLMQTVSAVENGQTAAVWLKTEKEVTLKKVYQEPGRIRLQPANSRMQPLYFSPDNVEIQGRVIGVIRRLG